MVAFLGCGVTAQGLLRVSEAILREWVRRVGLERVCWVLGCHWKQQAAPHRNPSPVQCPGLSLPFGLSEAGPAVLGSSSSKLVVSTAGPSLCLFPSCAHVCAGVSGGTAAGLLSGTKFSRQSLFLKRVTGACFCFQSQPFLSIHRLDFFFSSGKDYPK